MKMARIFSVSSFESVVAAVTKLPIMAHWERECWLEYGGRTMGLVNSSINSQEMLWILEFTAACFSFWTKCQQQNIGMCAAWLQNNMTCTFQDKWPPFFCKISHKHVNVCTLIAPLTVTLPENFFFFQANPVIIEWFFPLWQVFATNGCFSKISWPFLKKLFLRTVTSSVQSDFYQKLLESKNSSFGQELSLPQNETRLSALPLKRRKNRLGLISSQE